MLKQLKLWLGLLISVVCVYFAIQGIQWEQLGKALGNVNWWLIALSLMPYSLIMVLKTTRWQLLFYPERSPKFQRLFSALMISYLFNTILPARLGEVVRAYAVARTTSFGTVRVLSTILLEKILDIITVFVFLICLLPFLEVESWIRQSAFVLGGGVIAAFLVCLLMAANRQTAEKITLWGLKFLPAKIRQPLYGLVSEILDSLRVLLNWRISLKLWAQSLLIWSINISIYLLVAWAMNLNLSFGQGVLVMITANLGMAIPSSPGYVGVFEAVIRATLLPFYPGQETLILAYALMEHVTGFLPVVIAGAVYSWLEGISLGSVKADKPKAGGFGPTLAQPETPE